jgi:hypothetical protein
MTKRFHHRMPSIHNLQHIIVTIIMIRKLRPYISFLQRNLREAEQTISRGDVIDRIAQYTIIFLRDLFEESAECLVCFGL